MGEEFPPSTEQAAAGIPPDVQTHGEITEDLGKRILTPDVIMWALLLFRVRQREIVRRKTFPEKQEGRLLLTRVLCSELSTLWTCSLLGTSFRE